MLKPLRPVGADWARELATVLKAVTCVTWSVELSNGDSEPSLLQQEAMAEERARASVLADPNVRAVIDAFPAATLESYAMTKG